MSGLSDEQLHQCRSFSDITGVQDQDIVRDLLARSNWQSDECLTDYLDWLDGASDEGASSRGHAMGPSGGSQVEHGAAGASAVICLDTDSDNDDISSDSVDSIDSDYASSDSVTCLSQDCVGTGDDSVDFEGGDDDSDNDGVPPEPSESLRLRYKGVPVNPCPASGLRMSALLRLSRPERMRAYDDPEAERATSWRRIVAAMRVLAAQVPSREALEDRSSTKYDNLMPTSNKSIPSPPSHPHIQLSTLARQVALRKGREAQQPGGHPHRRDKDTVVYVTPEQSLDCEHRLASLCAALDAELVVVEAKVAACVAANKLRDDHYNAADYVPNLQKDAVVDAQHSIQRDILVLWFQSFCQACELSTIYLQQSLQIPDAQLEKDFGYFGPLGVWREASTSRSMYYEPGSSPPAPQTVVQALAAVSGVCLLVGHRAAINHATGGLFQGDSLPHIDHITKLDGVMLNVIGSYNTSTELPVTKVLASGGKFVTGGYDEGSMGAFEIGMYAGPMRCSMSRFLRAQFNLMAFDKKLVFDATKTRKHPNGHHVQTNSVKILKTMPASATRCTARFIAVAVETVGAIRSGPDQHTMNQTWGDASMVTMVPTLQSRGTEHMHTNHGQALMDKHLLTPENAKNFDIVIDKIATAANGTPFPGGFLSSARKADPSGAAAARASRTASGLEAQHNAAIEAVKAGAPDAGGGKSSKADAIIYLLGRSAVVKAGTTGWEAYVEGALQGRKRGGKRGGKRAQQDARVEAVKAGAPSESGGGSKNAGMVHILSGGSKSSSLTWTERVDLAHTKRLKGATTRATNIRSASMALPIATHSHECMEQQCRRPVKMVQQFKNGRWYQNFHHHCVAKEGETVNGLSKHICSSCHQMARICKDAKCRYPKCSAGKSGCAHLHDGSCPPRK